MRRVLTVLLALWTPLSDSTQFGKGAEQDGMPQQARLVPLIGDANRERQHLGEDNVTSVDNREGVDPIVSHELGLQGANTREHLRSQQSALLTMQSQKETNNYVEMGNSRSLRQSKYGESDSRRTFGDDGDSEIRIASQPSMAPYGRPIPTRPAPTMRPATPWQSQTAGATNGAPMPLKENTDISNADGCLVREDGSYGSQDGDQVKIFFFYQVEAVPRTTETQINGILLDDIEITLVDFLIPMFFSGCEASSVATKQMGTGRFVGMSSKPADFVLRGFECTSKAIQPCFVVSGSMTVYTVGMVDAAVQAQMRVAIYKMMHSGAIAATISRINGVDLLNDTLNLATLPPTSAPTPQSTPPPTPLPTTANPTLSPTTLSPTTCPTTTKPSSAPITETPSAVPTTDQPTLFPSALPSTVAPSTSEPTTLVPTFETGAIEPVEPTAGTIQSPASVAPTTPEPHTESPSFLGDGRTNTSQTEADPDTTTEPTSTMAVPSVTQQPTNVQTDSAAVFVVDEEHKSAFEKVPVWAWVLMALALCVCCSYADPDHAEEDKGVNQTLREQERHTLANLNELDKERDAMHDSEAFSSVEYVRKLYRQ